MNLFDRISERLGELIDDVTVSERLSRRIDDAEQALSRGDAESAWATLQGVEAERSGIWRVDVLSGLALLGIGRAEEALGRLARAADNRDAPLVRIALARAAAHLDDLHAAREHYERALERRPSDVERFEIVTGLADLHERLGTAPLAIPALRQALRMRPADAELLARLGRALHADGDDDGAITVLDAAYRMDPPPAEALRLAGELRLNRGADGDLEGARLAYRRVLDNAPDDPVALEGSAQVHVREGRIADALPQLQQALTVAAIDDHARLHRRIGDCYAEANQWEQALDAYRAAAAMDDGDASIAAAYARAALRTDLFDEAVVAARAAFELDPTDRGSRALLGRALLATGAADEATRTLGPLRAARMSVDELHALGELALRTGDPIEGIALLREASVRQPGRAGLEALLESAYQALAPELPSLPRFEELDPTWLAPFLDALSEAVAAHPLLTDLIPRATALRQHLDTPLTVAVLGEFNAGKSTLINAFVGEAMVATGVLPTTSHVNVIRYGPRKTARWTREDGTVEELPYADAARLVKEAPETVANLEFCYPHPDLRSVHFWDTPGFNAPDSLHEERARQALRTADAVVWMLDANQALTSTEWDRLAAIPHPEEKLLVVLNKADRLGDDADAKRAVAEHVEGYLDGARVGVFWLSALRALEARRADDEDAEEKAGWRSFEAALHQSVFERAGRLKSLEVARGLADLLHDSLERTRTFDTLVSESRTRIREERTELEVVQSRWASTVAAEVRSEAARALQDVRSRTVRDIVQLSAPRPGLFTRRALPEEDRRLVRGQLVERVRSAYASAASDVVAAAEAVDLRLVEAVESIAAALGPPESRTVRRRLEAFLAETTALRRVAHERLVATPSELVRSRVTEWGDRLLDTVAEGGRTDAERTAFVQQLAPPPTEAWSEHTSSWGAEYGAAAARLCDHVERDLDILALDLEHRILRPFEEVLGALGEAAVRREEPKSAEDR